MLSIQLPVENPQPLESAKLNSPLHFLVFIVGDLRSGCRNNLEYELKHIDFGMPRTSIQKRGNEHLERRFSSTIELPLNDNMIFNFPITFLRFFC